VSWVAIDDKYPDHPKVALLPREIRAAAHWLHTCALCYCNRQLTDGFVSAGKLDDLYTLGDHDPADLAKALRKAGMWEKARGGWQIHDYEEYQPSRQEVERKRVVDHGKKVAAGKARAASAPRSAGGAFEKKDAGQDQHNQQTHQHPTSTPPAPQPAADQPPSLTQALKTLGQTPVSSRSSGSQREESGSYPQADDPTIAIETYIGKLDRDLTADEKRSVKRWVNCFGSQTTCVGIGYAAQDGFAADFARTYGQIKALHERTAATA